jgi:hypothetical protein
MPTLPADTVRDAAGGEHQRREHQAVCVDDPLQLTGRGVQLAHQRRQRDVHDRRIEVDRERREQQRNQDQRSPGRAQPGGPDATGRDCRRSTDGLTV